MQPTTSVGECRSTGTSRMCSHSCSDAEYNSAFGASRTSSVSTLPSGSKVQPSSALKSFLPSDSRFLQRIVRGSKALVCFVSLSPNRNRPSASTADGESPILLKPGGGASGDQVSV